MANLVPVIVAPFEDAVLGRRELSLPHGMTIAEILTDAGIRESDWPWFRVTLVTAAGMQVVDRKWWDRARPNPGVSVVIRAIPAGNNFRKILAVVVSIAAIALGQYWGVALAGTLGLSAGVWSSLITAGLTVLGNLAINALIPPSSPNGDSNTLRGDAKKSNNYSITGWKNQVRLNEPVPAIYGKLRYAPPFAVLPYTEIINDLQYMRAVFCFGYGPVKITDHQIGDTSLDEYEDVEIEVREGRPTDLPLTIVTRQPIEEQIGVELTRPLPRDDAGNIVSGASLEKPLVRTTGRSVTRASVIFGFPSGLGQLDASGNLASVTVSIRIRQRKLPDGVFEDVTTLNITASKLESFFRQYSWELPERGVYEIESTRLTDEHTSTRIQSRSLWSVLQSSRPEYPINMKKPLALVAIKIKASYQLNGILDNYNALASRLCLDYDVETDQWNEAETSNPASAYRLALQGDHWATPVGDAGIDLPALESLHEYCSTNNLKFDAVIDRPFKVGEVWSQILHAARSMQRHNGLQWSVVTDRPADLPIVDHISHRDTFGFSCKRQYFTPPHGFRTEFLDATNDYKPTERIIPWPGHVGAITVTERFDQPGKTDPDEIWIEARRRMYELIYRPDVFTAVLDTPLTTATRGSRVAASFPTLKSHQKAARVMRAEGQLIVLDDDVTMVEGQSYAIRFQNFSEADTVGASVVRAVRTIVGSSKLLSLADSGELPDVGHMVHFGIAGEQSFDLLATRIEAGENMASVFQYSAIGTEIDEQLANDIPPAWSGVIGNEIDDTAFEPQPPIFDSIVSGISGTGVEGRIRVSLHASSTGAPVSTFEIHHRVAGAWSIETIAAADGSVDIDAYASGTVVEIRALAKTIYGVASDFNTTVTIIVGNDDADVPDALPASISATAGLGSAAINFETGVDAATVAVNIYSNSNGTLDKVADLRATIATTPSQPYSTTLGDATRTNRLTNADFSNPADWSAGTGWSIAAGVATHAAGAASDLSQTDAGLADGQFYRFGFTLSGVSSGTLTAALKGGSTVSGVAYSSAGTFSDRLQAVAGNNEAAFAASSGFDGSVDDVVLYRETVTCLPQGVNYIWLAPQNSDGLEGPVSGPFQVTII